jgi:thimet oligopeptidase
LNAQAFLVGSFRCWEKASLKLMSGHYKDGTPLPESLLESLISTKKAHAGLLCKRQLFLGERLYSDLL